MSSLCLCLLGDLATSFKNSANIYYLLTCVRYCSRCSVCGSERDPAHALVGIRVQKRHYNQTQRCFISQKDVEEDERDVASWHESLARGITLTFFIFHVGGYNYFLEFYPQCCDLTIIFLWWRKFQVVSSLPSLTWWFSRGHRPGTCGCQLVTSSSDVTCVRPVFMKHGRLIAGPPPPSVIKILVLGPVSSISCL